MPYKRPHKRDRKPLAEWEQFVKERFPHRSEQERATMVFWLILWGYVND